MPLLTITNLPFSTQANLLCTLKHKSLNGVSCNKNKQMSSLSFSLKKCCLIRRVFDYTFSKICTILLFVHGLFRLKVIIGANFHFPHLISGVFDILATIYCAVIPKIISALPIMTTLPAVHNVNTPEIDTDSETRKNSDCSSSLDTFKYLT